jgi:hypothetical protein
VLSDNISKAKLLIFLRGSTESRYSITAVVCYIAKIQQTPEYPARDYPASVLSGLVFFYRN